MKTNYKLNVSGYADNAAKKFSYLRIIIYTLISLILTALLVYTFVKEKYQGVAMIFTAIVIFLIGGFVILNIIALIKKIRNK